jgi:hypothetical protein
MSTEWNCWALRSWSSSRRAGRTLEGPRNEAVRLGQSEHRWYKLAKRGLNYSRELAEATTDEEAIEIAVEAVHGTRAVVRSGR